MNLIELLISSRVIESTKSIEHLLRTYNLFTQYMNRLNHYGSYEVKNFEKFNLVVCLVLCISTLFPPEKALQII